MVNTSSRTRSSKPVQISNTAATMLSTLYPKSPAKVKAAIVQIESDIDDPSKVRRVVGHDDVFVARGHGMRILFTRKGDTSVITSVASDS